MNLQECYLSRSKGVSIKQTSNPSPSRIIQRQKPRLHKSRIAEPQLAARLACFVPFVLGLARFLRPGTCIFAWNTPKRKVPTTSVSFYVAFDYSLLLSKETSHFLISSWNRYMPITMQYLCSPRYKSPLSYSSTSRFQAPVLALQKRKLKTIPSSR